MNKKTTKRKYNSAIYIYILIALFIVAIVILLNSLPEKFDHNLHDCTKYELVCPDVYPDICYNQDGSFNLTSWYRDERGFCEDWEDKSESDLLMNKDCNWLKFEIAKCKTSEMGWTIYTCNDKYIENLRKVYDKKCGGIINHPPEIISIKNKPEINYSLNYSEVDWAGWKKRYKTVTYNLSNCHQVTCDCYEEFGCMAYCFMCDENIDMTYEPNDLGEYCINTTFEKYPLNSSEEGDFIILNMLTLLEDLERIKEVSKEMSHQTLDAYFYNLKCVWGLI